MRVCAACMTKPRVLATTHESWSRSSGLACMCRRRHAEAARCCTTSACSCACSFTALRRLTLAEAGLPASRAPMAAVGRRRARLRRTPHTRARARASAGGALGEPARRAGGARGRAAAGRAASRPGGGRRGRRAAGAGAAGPRRAGGRAGGRGRARCARRARRGGRGGRARRRPAPARAPGAPARARRSQAPRVMAFLEAASLHACTLQPAGWLPAACGRLHALASVVAGGATANGRLACARKQQRTAAPRPVFL